MARYESIVRKLQKFGFIEQGKLTEKGVFSSKIFADEITLGEVFATDIVQSMDEYQILLLIACMVYEPREGSTFKKKFPSEQLRKLKNILLKNDHLQREKKFLLLETITTFIYPIYNGQNFFELLTLTSLLEGDLIRFYSQMLDRIGQIKKATTDRALQDKMINCQGIVEKGLEGIYLV